MGELTKSENSLEDGQALVRKGVYASLAAGLVPVPVFDALAVAGIQLELLRRLSHVYGVTFMEGKGKNALAALIGGSFPTSVAPTLASLVKVVPLVGTTLGGLSVSLTAGASTYAIGKVFIQHFESGGTFLTFDPEAVRDYFSEQIKEGKTVAAQTKKSA
ncbi:MAG TPA: DUF697 domain-containing protein [Methylococcales bacterium]|nr:DUF697 domain-containing protein [Methylococcales bacterium]